MPSAKDAARQVIERIFGAAEKLQDHSKMGRPVP